MKNFISSFTALLLISNSISATAESLSGEVRSKQSLNSYTITINGKAYATTFSEPIDLKIGHTVFFEGDKSGQTIQVIDNASVGLMQR